MGGTWSDAPGRDETRPAGGGGPPPQQLDRLRQACVCACVCTSARARSCSCWCCCCCRRRRCHCCCCHLKHHSNSHCHYHHRHVISLPTDFVGGPPTGGWPSRPSNGPAFQPSKRAGGDRLGPRARLRRRATKRRGHEGRGRGCQCTELSGPCIVWRARACVCVCGGCLCTGRRSCTRVPAVGQRSQRPGRDAGTRGVGAAARPP